MNKFDIIYNDTMKGQAMTVKEDPRTFSALVRAIDEKWSHTYEEIPEQPVMSQEMKEYMERLLDEEGYNDEEKF